MKKIYQSPETIFVKVVNTHHLLEASPGGIATGAKVGDEYSSSDTSYGRRGGFWDDDED